MAENKIQSGARPYQVAVWFLGLVAIIATPWADAYLNSSAVWPFKALVCLIGGLSVASAWLCFPREILAHIEANLITGGRFFLFWFGIFAFFHWSMYAGHLILVSSAIWDVLDGKAEIKRKERGYLRSKLNRWIGKWLDPLVDKFTVLPLIAIFSCRGVINPWIVVAVISFDALGTVLREPCTTFVRLFRYQPSMTWRTRLHAEIEKSLENESRRDLPDAENDKNLKKESKATAIGKVKALVQCLGLEFCLPFFLGWVARSRQPDYVFIGAAVLGFMSVASRHIPPTRFMSWANSFFKHQDVL